MLTPRAGKVSGNTKMWSKDICFKGSWKSKVDYLSWQQIITLQSTLKGTSALEKNYLSPEYYNLRVDAMLASEKSVQMAVLKVVGDTQGLTHVFN